MVGDEKKTFRVHENLVRASSPFFEKALNGPWKEASERTVALPLDTSEAVEIYVYWLYYRTIPALGDDEDCQSQYTCLFEAYILGEKLLDLDFHNTVVDAIIERSTTPVPNGNLWYPDDELIIYAYANSSPSAPIRELMVDIYLYHGHSAWFEGSHDLSGPFLLKLVSRLFKERLYINRSLNPTNYHREKGDDADGEITDLTRKTENVEV